MSVPAEAVAAASREWVWVPETATTVETPEYLLARMPDWFDVQLELLRLDPERPVGEVVDEVLARARELGGPEVNCWVKLHNDPSLDAVLLARGGVLDETLDVLALDLSDGLPDFGAWDQRIELRWVTDVATARDHHEVGMVVFGGEMAPDDELERAAADGRRQLPAGEGGAVVAYLDGGPVGAGGIAQPGDVARLWGGSVREEARGRGVYRALLDARMGYGLEHGATMALVKGRVQTSGPILRRAGFERYGEERSYLVPLDADPGRAAGRDGDSVTGLEPGTVSRRSCATRGRRRSALEELRGLVDVLDQVHVRLHRPTAGQRSSSGQAGRVLGPVGPADEHHRRHRGLVGVVVLAGVLEDLLDRAGHAGEEHDARVADLEQDRLALGVAHVLGDRGGHHVGRLVPVEPGRDAEGVGAAGQQVQHVEGGAHPGLDRRAERRHGASRASASSRSSDEGSRRGQVPAEVRGLHRAWAAAGGDHVAGAQPQPEPGGVGVARRAPLQRVAAHHADQAPAGTQSVSATSMAWSCRAFAIVASRSWAVWDQA